jgi:HlyD family secretion protein
MAIHSFNSSERVNQVELTEAKEMGKDESAPLIPIPTVPADQLIPSQKFKKKRSILKWPFRLLLLGLVSGVGYVIYRQMIPTDKAPPDMALVPLSRRDITMTVSANGFIQPEQAINVSPKNAGIMTSLLVAEGDSVQKGQPLAKMDDSNLQGQLIEVKGRLAKARANLRLLMAGNRTQDVAQAQSRVESAQALLTQTEDDFSRTEKLYQAGGIALQVLNQRRADRDSAKAKVEEVKQALSLQQSGSRQEEIDQAKAEVVAAIGSVKSIQTQLDDTIVRAPFSGFVNRKYADPGAFVTPMTAGSAVSSATSSSILALASTNQVVANIAESSIGKIRVGQIVTVKADAFPNKTFQAKVYQIATQAIVEQNVTSFQVKARLLGNAAQQLRAGMNISTEFNVGQVKQAVTVPTIAVTRQNNETGVFLAIPQQKPIFTPITIGASIENQTEVKAGLKGHEMVLIKLPPKPKPPSWFSFPGLFGSSPMDQGGPPPGGPPPGGVGPPGGGGGPPGAVGALGPPGGGVPPGR